MEERAERRDDRFAARKIADSSNDRCEKEERPGAEEGVRILSVDKVTVEKIVLERAGSREVLLTKSESSRKVAELKKKFLVRPRVAQEGLVGTRSSADKTSGNSRASSAFGRGGQVAPKSACGRANATPPERKPIRAKNHSRLPISKVQKSGSATCLTTEKRISPARLTKSRSIGSLIKGNKFGKSSSPSKVSKAPPRVPEKPAVKRSLVASSTGTGGTPPVDGGGGEGAAEIGKYADLDREPVKDEGGQEATTVRREKRRAEDGTSVGLSTGLEDRKTAGEEAEGRESSATIRSKEEGGSCFKSAARDRLEKSQEQIERLQQNLTTKINASTAETYKSKLRDVRANSVKPRLSGELDLNENLTQTTFDKEFLERHNFDKKLKIEEKRVPETDPDCGSDAEKSESAEGTRKIEIEKPKYGKKVSEVEKRWSGEFLESQLEQISSGSSKSSYVEELGSVSSRESIVEEGGRFSERICRGRSVGGKLGGSKRSIAKQLSEEVLEDTVGTVDSDSSFEGRISDIDKDIDRAEKKDASIEEGEEDLDESGSKDSTLKDSSVKTCRTGKISEDSGTLPDDDVDEGSDKFPGYVGKDSTGSLKEREKCGRIESPAENSVLRSDEAGDNSIAAREEDAPPAKVNAPKSPANEHVRDKSGGKKIVPPSVPSKPSAVKVTAIGGRPTSREKEEAKEEATFPPSSAAPSSVAASRDSRDTSKGATRSDGYASLIREFTMEAGGPSKPVKDEKKRKGFRRLLPGLFSPKDSRKDYGKKEQRERKKREEKHFARHQQNGNYIRSPDTTNLNEDIKRNVKLDASLNSSIIEERLNEIKHELFPEQGIITSTPDYLLQSDGALIQDGRRARTCTANSSLSSIAPEDKWIDQNIISGSPDMRQFKQRGDSIDCDRRCGLERKHSLQETNQRCFFRNHGPSGRISAPPTERYLIRPRAVHPVDRPLPAIPQKMEFSNYENHGDSVRRYAREAPRGRRRTEAQNYPRESAYLSDARDRIDGNGNESDARHARLYENSCDNLDEKSEEILVRNQSVDSGFNLTPVSAQVKITRQPIVNQNQRAALTGRSPKYSPSSSQKSGDYADSSYTPNSSQKSEFSPSSSKSGEYYLNSPRHSNQTSPNDSFNDRRELIYENGQPSPRTCNPMSPHVRIQCGDDRLYDETPRCDDGSPEVGCDKSSPVSRGAGRAASAAQESLYAQRMSPNIPMSNNLAKLRASVDNENAKRVESRVASPVSNLAMRRVASPVRSPTRDTGGGVVSPSRLQGGMASPARSPRDSDGMRRMSSPLAIVPSSPIPGPVSPTIASRVPVAARVTRPTDVSPCASPGPDRSASDPRHAVRSDRTTGATPISSPNASRQTRTTPAGAGGPCVSASSRRSQPAEQILIASPKREAIYESRGGRPPNRMESECPGSPIPMADSPSQVLGSRQSLERVVVVVERPGHRELSPVIAVESAGSASGETIHAGGQPLPRISPSRRALSPGAAATGSSQNIPRPEPIYVQRPPSATTPAATRANARRNASPAERQTILASPTKSEQIRLQGPAPAAAASPPISPRIRNEYDANKNASPRELGIFVDKQIQRQSPIPVPSASPSRSTPTLTSTHPQRPDGVNAQRAASTTHRRIYSASQSDFSASQEQIYGVARSPSRQEPLYGQRSASQRDRDASACSQTSSEPIYAHQPNRQSSPSKKQTMRHLEAFYWQQKALEAQRKSMASPTSSCRHNEPEPQLDLPEVREAVYWQQLKKLDEEQQRRIYEQNVLDERSDSLYWRKKLQSSPVVPTSSGAGHASSPNPNRASPVSAEQLYWRNKLQQPKTGGNPAGKPPIMGQKGQHQRVLVVRPQPAVLEPDPPSREVEQEVPRSKSVSPHFARGDQERRSSSLSRKSAENDDGGFLRSNREKSSVAALCGKGDTPPVYEEEAVDGDKRPAPIFKRGSLISNSSSSVDYGTLGPKRVSFSNQSNAGIWPTKHGMAPEPPTRKAKIEHRSATCSSDSDSVFLHDEENQNNSNSNIYGNVVARSLSQSGDDASKTWNPTISEPEYDANRPLPAPPPKESSRMVRRGVGLQRGAARDGSSAGMIAKGGNFVGPRKWPGISESESGSEAGEVQRILQRRLEEEWNSDGKGRQSNDTGGRGEGEGGSNDLPGGRRGTGGGILGGGGGGGSRCSGGTGSGGGGRSRDEPRRHTLSGDHQPSLHHQQFNAQLHPLHPHHLPPPHGQYGTPPNRHTTMDLEMGTKSRQRKSPLPRGYPPPSSTMLFDDDPGIMSEVETSSTGFRRGGKQRSSLPVVRTPSKTLERPLGLVFLQYRNETKRALLPNEITSIDTVKALFVRSFPKQLTMEYLDSPHVKVYIHDSNKDMFYELEDLRSHLRDIRDRSVLRLFESTDGGAAMPGPLGPPGAGTGLPPHWEDQSYFSEPEFDSEFQHQHIHKSKTAKNSTSGSGGYYMGSSSSTLPRGGPLLRAYSPAASSVVAGPNATPSQPKTLTTPGGGGVAPAKPLRSYQCGKSPLGSLGGSARFSRDSSVSLYSIPDRIHGESGYMSSPERGGGVGTGSGRYPAGPYSGGSSYEDPYYSQYSGTVTPVIDEEASDTELLEESYSLYGVKPPGRPPSGPPRSPFPPGAPPLPPGGQPYDVTRIRVEHMERQLANLTGLVQKALTHAPHTSPSPRDYLQVPAPRDPYRTTGAGDEFDKHSSSSSASLPDDSYLRTDVKPPKLGKDKSVSFEKSVSFSDEPPDMNSPKQHSPQHAADTKPTKPAIKSSTLPRMSSQERDRHKPTPPPKPAALAAGQYVYRDLALTPEMYNQLRGLQKKAKDLRQEVRNLRRMSQAQAHTVRETIRDTFITIRAMLMSGVDAAWASGDTEKIRLSREEDLYKQEMIRLEKDLTELESTVEELRGNVINRKTRVNMSDVENMALILSKSSKTVADLKVRFPSLQEGMKGLLSSEMEKVVREEKFLKEEPERLESALRRCKKLTGTLVTLKRLASVQEQRLPNAASVEAEETPPVTPTSAQHSKTTAPVPAERTVVGSAGVLGGGSHLVDPSAAYQQRPENALDALLDELQTFSRPASQLSQASSIGLSGNHPPSLSEIGRSASQVVGAGRAPSMSDIGRKGSVDSSTSLAIVTPGHTNTLRRLHSYPSSSDTDTSPPIARLQVSDGSVPPQKPPVPERNAELLQLATARRVPPPPPPRTSSRSPLASPTSPQLPPRNPTSTLRRGRGGAKDGGGKPPMALPPNLTSDPEQIPPNNILSTSNSSSCESINSQEGLQNKKGRQEQLEQRHQELLRKQKALQEQYARLQQLQRNASGLTTVPPAPPDLLKKTGSESNLLAKMGLGLSTASSGSLTSLSIKPSHEQSATQMQNAGSGQQTTTSKIYETDIL